MDDGKHSSSGDEEIIKFIARQNSKGVDSRQEKGDLEKRLRMFTSDGKNMKNKNWRIMEGILTPKISAKAQSVAQSRSD